MASIHGGNRCNTCRVVSCRVVSCRVVSVSVSYWCLHEAVVTPYYDERVFHDSVHEIDRQNSFVLSLDAVGIAAVLGGTQAERDLIHGNQPLHGAVRVEICLLRTRSRGGWEGDKERRPGRYAPSELRPQPRAVAQKIAGRRNGVGRCPDRGLHIQTEGSSWMQPLYLHPCLSPLLSSLQYRRACSATNRGRRASSIYPNRYCGVLKDAGPDPAREPCFSAYFPAYTAVASRSVQASTSAGGARHRP